MSSRGLVSLGESQPLFLTDVEDAPVRKRPNFFWTVFMWILGLVEWAEPSDAHRRVRVTIERTDIQRRTLFLSSLFFLLVLMASSLFTVTWFFLCLFGHSRQITWFGSFSLFYWPIVTSPIVICFFTAIRNYSTRHCRSALRLTWTRVFSETYFANRYAHLGNTQSWGCTPYNSCFFTFSFSFAAVNTVLEILHLIEIGMGQGCQTWPRYVCTFSSITSLFMFAAFCYFLYLNRVSVQSESEQTLSFVESHSSDEKLCKVKIANFFGKYIQLRKFIFPWLNVLIFSTTFGMTIFFTLNNNHLGPHSHNSTQELGNGTDYLWWSSINRDEYIICGVSCNSTSTTHRWEHGFLIYDMMIFSEKLMVAILGLMTVGAIDLAYIWNGFKMHLNVLPVDKVKNRDSFVEYVKFMHPDPTSATIASFVIPLLGIACGTLGGNKWEK